MRAPAGKLDRAHERLALYIRDQAAWRTSGGKRVIAPSSARSVWDMRDGAYRSSRLKNPRGLPNNAQRLKRSRW